MTFKRKRFLTGTIEDLINDADKYKLDASKKKDFPLLERSNDLQSLLKAKENELKELDEIEESYSFRKREYLEKFKDVMC